jgi:spore coat polysaccharide biosynthesis predicted glycosyltransferase SpsG/CMP-N-acetylneuraminic acid synthetase
MKDTLIVIPAIKKNAVIPDQLIKKLNGITLIQRAINTSLQIVSKSQIYILTDSDEISLIAQRNNIKFFKDSKLSLNSENLIQNALEKIEHYNHQNIIIYRANTPLIDSETIKKAHREYLNNISSLIVSVKKEERNVFQLDKNNLKKIKLHNIYDELGAFYIFNKSIAKQGDLKSIPFIIPDEKSIEIKNYQNWWVCEKILQRKRVVFHVFGSVDIGMGHIYHALSLAHEITNHEVYFVCDQKYELAVRKIASMDYKVVSSSNVEREIIDLKPDIVINDILNTSDFYIKNLRKKGISVVNFEDLGSGSVYANLVFNELYEIPQIEGENFHWGHEFVTLRDEFYGAKTNLFTGKINEVLIIFGGVDKHNLTLVALKAIVKICQTMSIKINIVCGRGYQFTNILKAFLSKSDYKNIQLHLDTAVISKIMELSQLAISSNGRTIYELAEMNIPSIIISHHQREFNHGFSTIERGFVNIGIVNINTQIEIQNAFEKLVNHEEYRRDLYKKMHDYSFRANKKRVIGKILSLLD